MGVFFPMSGLTVIQMEQIPGTQKFQYYPYEDMNAVIAYNFHFAYCTTFVSTIINLSVFHLIILSSHRRKQRSGGSFGPQCNASKPLKTLWRVLLSGIGRRGMNRLSDLRIR